MGSKRVSWARGLAMLMLGASVVHGPPAFEAYAGELVFDGDPTEPVTSTDVPGTRITAVTIDWSDVMVSGTSLAVTDDVEGVLISSFQAQPTLPDFAGRLIEPPDVAGAVGPYQAMSVHNSRYRIQDRHGNTISETTASGFWDPIADIWVEYDEEGNVTDSRLAVDPRVVYDPDIERWYITAITPAAGATNRNSAMLFAVSHGTDAGGRWTLYRVDADGEDDGSATLDGHVMLDFPMIGLNADWVVVSHLAFFYCDDPGTTELEVYTLAKLWAFDKDDFTSTPSANPQIWEWEPGATGVPTPGDLAPLVMSPAIMEGTDSEDVYLVTNELTGDETDVNADGDNEYRISRITAGAAGSGDLVWEPLEHGGAPAQGDPTVGHYVAEENYIHGEFPDASQVEADEEGVSQEKIDALDHRIATPHCRDGRLWFAHCGGVEDSAGSGEHVAIHWAEFDTTSTPREFVQAGTIDGGDGVWNLFPSIAVNEDGDVAIGFTRTSDETWPSAYYTYRESDDTPGTMRTPVCLRAGEGEYEYERVPDANVHRWGDYSTTVVDPVDGTTFWTIQQYAHEQDDPSGDPEMRWGTWWGRFRIEEPTYVGGTGEPTEIQEAIDNASDGDIIIVRSGTYDENIDFDGKDVMVQSVDPGDPAVIAATIIDGQSGGPAATFDGTETWAAQLSGFTIRHLDGTGEKKGIHGNGTRAVVAGCVIRDCEASLGAAVTSWRGVLLTSTLRDNTATFEGGAIWNSVGGSLISGCVFEDNTAQWGGAISDVNGRISVCGFDGNYASDSGGAVHQFLDGDITWSGFHSNLAANEGGAIHDFDGDAISYSLFDLNSSDTGGAIELAPDAHILGCYFYTNVSDGEGGALRDCDGPITDSVFRDNYSEDGDGGAIARCGGTFERNRCYDNAADTGGGGVFAYCGGAVIQNNVFYNNSAKNGGVGFHSNAVVQANAFVLNSVSSKGGALRKIEGGSAKIRNNIFFDNTAGQQPNISGSVTANFCFFPTGQYAGGSGNVHESAPGFVDVGGPSTLWDFHLVSTSPCINEGKDLSSGTYALTEDMDGEPRASPTNADYDIGPDEVQ